MGPRRYADVTVQQCSGCQGLFLDSAYLGALVEAENDWHAHRSTDTAQLPRITGDMSAPPPSRPHSRSFVEALFRS